MVINVLRNTRASDPPLCMPVADLRFPQHHKIVMHVGSPSASAEMLLLPQPEWMKNRIQDEIANCLCKFELKSNSTLFIGDIPSEEALTYTAAIERSDKFSRPPFTMLGRVVLVTRELKTCVLSRSGGDLLEHDPQESRDFLYNAAPASGGINGMASYFASLRAHDSALAWELILCSGEAFTWQCVAWSNNLVLDGYLDFPQSIAHPVCRELYSLALNRLLSLFPVTGADFQALDTLVESLLVRFDAAHHVSPARDHTKTEILTLNIGSVQVSGLTANSAAENENVTFFFFVHPSGESIGRSLFEWHPAAKPASGPCVQARVGRTPVVAPGGWKSFQMPRFDGNSSIYEEAPRETYRAWQEPSRTPMKLGHWCYGGHHDLITLNLLLAFDTELDKINLEVAGSMARFVYANFFRLFGLRADELDPRRERLLDAIQKESYTHLLPEGLNARKALLVYPSHPVTDHVIDRFLGLIQEPTLSRIRERILPILPIRRHRTGSGLQVSGLVLQRLASLDEPKPPVVFFDDALITGRTYAEFKSLLRGLAIHEIYSLVLVDRLRFPSSKHVDGARHLCFWRLDVPPMGSEGSCPLCRSLTAVRQMAAALKSSADRMRVLSWSETWRPLNPATQWSDGGLQPIPLHLNHPVRRFSIEPDPDQPGRYRQCGGQNREIEITNSAGLVSWISELHSITYRDDLCLAALRKDSVDPEARIQVLASQLLLYFPEFDAPIAKDIGLQLVQALWDAERHDRHTALASLTLVSCGEHWLCDIIGTFLTPKRLLELPTRNIDVVLLSVIADTAGGTLKSQPGISEDIWKLEEVGVVRMAEVRSTNKLQLYDHFHRLVMDARGKQHSSLLNQFANSGDDPLLLSEEFLEQVKGTIAILFAVVDEIKQSNIRARAPIHGDFVGIREHLRFCYVMVRDKLQQIVSLEEGDIEQRRAAFLCAREWIRIYLEACRQLHFGIFAPIGLRERSQGREVSEFSFNRELLAVTDAGPFRGDPSLFQWHRPTPYEIAVAFGELKIDDLAEAYVIWDEEVVDALRQLLTNARHATGDAFSDPWSRIKDSSAPRARMWGRLILEKEYLSIELRNRAELTAREVDELTRKKPVSRTIRSHGDLDYESDNDGTLVTKVAFPYAHTLSALQGT